jgi:hypothetical protein
MTGPAPTGRVVPTPDGRDLVLTRSFRAPIEDVWASITESDRTARWFASWSGEPGPGRTIRYRLTFEESGPEGDMTIERRAIRRATSQSPRRTSTAHGASKPRSPRSTA